MGTWQERDARAEKVSSGLRSIRDDLDLVRQKMLELDAEQASVRVTRAEVLHEAFAVLLDEGFYDAAYRVSRMIDGES